MQQMSQRDSSVSAWRESSSAWLSLEQIAAKPGSGCFVLCEFQQGMHILHTAYGNNKAAVGIFFPVFSQ